MNARTQRDLTALLASVSETIELCADRQMAHGSFWNRMLVAAQLDLHRALGIITVGEASQTELEAVNGAARQTIRKTINNSPQ